jgi:uncharacterized protein
MEKAFFCLGRLLAVCRPVDGHRRGDFTPASDFDFLAEFSGSPSLTDYLGLREDLRSLFGREVDLVLPAAVRNPYIRATIERDRQLLYAA